MPRGRTIKYPPKRGNLKRSDMKRVIQEIVLGEEAHKTAAGSRRSTTVTVARDAKTGRFVSRENADSQTENVVVETVKKPKRKK